MERKFSFDSLSGNNSPNRKRLIDAAAAASDHRAGKNLGPCFLALVDQAVNIDGVTDLKERALLVSCSISRPTP